MGPSLLLSYSDITNYIDEYVNVLKLDYFREGRKQVSCTFRSPYLYYRHTDTHVLTERTA